MGRSEFPLVTLKKTTTILIMKAIDLLAKTRKTRMRQPNSEYQCITGVTHELVCIELYKNLFVDPPRCKQIEGARGMRIGKVYILDISSGMCFYSTIGIMVVMGIMSERVARLLHVHTRLNRLNHLVLTSRSLRIVRNDVTISFLHSVCKLGCVENLDERLFEIIILKQNKISKVRSLRENKARYFTFSSSVSKHKGQFQIMLISFLVRIRSSTVISLQHNYH